MSPSPSLPFTHTPHDPPSIFFSVLTARHKSIPNLNFGVKTCTFKLFKKKFLKTLKTWIKKRINYYQMKNIVCYYYNNSCWFLCFSALILVFHGGGALNSLAKFRWHHFHPRTASIVGVTRVIPPDVAPGSDHVGTSPRPPPLTVNHEFKSHAPTQRMINLKNRKLVN